jgi:hypothetical protein
LKRKSSHTVFESAQSRKESAPYFSVTSSKGTKFPTDFDIFSPFSSTKNPCMRSVL